MVRFILALVFVSAVAAQPPQGGVPPPRNGDGDNELPMFTRGPGSGGFPFRRFSSPPLIFGPGPVIGGNGFNGDNSQGGSLTDNSGSPFLGNNQFPFNGQNENNDNNRENNIPAIGRPNSIINNRNNLPRNENGFPSIAGPGPVVSSPAGIRQKRAVPKAKITVSSTPATSLGGNREGQNVPSSQGFESASNQQQGSDSNNGLPNNQESGFSNNGQRQGFGFEFPSNQGQQSGFGVPGNQQSGFPNGQQFGFNNGQQFPSPGFPSGQQGGFGNNQGFGSPFNPIGSGAFGNGQQNGIGFPGNQQIGSTIPPYALPNGQQSGFGFNFGNSQPNNGFPNNAQQQGFPFNNQSPFPNPQQPQPNRVGGQSVETASN